MFLAAYLLMIGVDPKISAVVVLFVKIWDAANDAIFGIHRRHSVQFPAS